MSEPIDVDPLACRQHGCDQPAMYRFTWPGRDESYCCFVCAAKLRHVAAAIGMHLQLIQLGADDYSKMMAVPAERGEGVPRE